MSLLQDPFWGPLVHMCLLWMVLGMAVGGFCLFADFCKKWAQEAVR